MTVTGESTESGAPTGMRLPLGLRLLTVWMALGGALSVVYLFRPEVHALFHTAEQP